MIKQYFSSVLLIAGILFFGNAVSAQTLSRTVVAAGTETFTTPNITISYVLGEVVGELLPDANANLFLTTGFVQPTIDVQLAGTSIPQTLIVYPNPVHGGSVKLAFNKMPDGVYTISIIDQTGRILQSQSVTYSLNSFYYVPLDISRLSGGVYYIKVVNNLNFQATVKLIKI